MDICEVYPRCGSFCGGKVNSDLPTSFHKRHIEQLAFHWDQSWVESWLKSWTNGGLIMKKWNHFEASEHFRVLS